MMKKITRIAALLAATALLFGAIGCSDSEESGNGGEKDPPPAGSGAEATADTWTLTGASMTIKGFEVVKNNNKYDLTDEKTAISKSNSTVLLEDYVMDGANSKLKLTLANYAGTGVGTSLSTVKEAPTYPVTGQEKAPEAVQYKLDADKGLCIKRDALKVAGVKGSVKLTVEWYCNSNESSKAESERRKLEVTVGADGETKTQAVNTIESNEGKTQGKMNDFTLDVDGGTDGVDIYIGSSNEVYIQKIIVE